jgi:hypothetical protein
MIFLAAGLNPFYTGAVRKWLVFLWLGFWLYLCLVPALETGTQSYANWRALSFTPNAACSAVELCPELLPRFLRGLLVWVISSPILAWALFRYPKKWPSPYRLALWNQERFSLSFVSGLMLLMVLASFLSSIQQAPYEAARITQGIAFLPVMLLGLIYRSALLSAPES